VPMVAMLVATFMHVPLCLFFVKYLDMDIRGLAVASSVKDGIALLTVMIYSYVSDAIRPNMSMPDSESFSGWSDYLKVSIPSTVMICA